LACTQTRKTAEKCTPRHHTSSTHLPLKIKLLKDKIALENYSSKEWDMWKKSSMRLLVVFSMCILVLNLHAQEAIQVIGKDQGSIELGSGLVQGVQKGATGRIFLKEMVDGKMVQIYLAKFRIVSVEAHRCRALVLEKKREITIGDLAVFDLPLKAPAKVNVTPNKNAAKAEKAKYPVRIEVDPADAEITINGTEKGSSGLQVTLDAPRCEVSISRQGYKSVTEVFELPSGGMIKSYRLKPLSTTEGIKPSNLAKPRTGKFPLRIVVEPADAEIILNNGFKSLSPLEVTLNSSRCEIRIVRQGYETLTETLDLNESGGVKSYKLNPVPVSSFSSGGKSTERSSSVNLTLKEIERKISRAKSTRTWGWIIFIPTTAWTGLMLGGFFAQLDEIDELWWQYVIFTIPTLVASIFSFSMIRRANRNLKKYRQMKSDLRLGLDIRPEMKRYGISFSWVF
jgi:hypothetical protein